MAITDSIPENINFLSPLLFRFQIKKSPHVNFFLQEATLPSVSLPPIESPNPFVKLPVFGDHIDFSALTITFKVDENLENYQELFQWIRDIGFASSYDEHSRIISQPRWTGLGIYSDVSLFILNSASNPRFEILFRDAVPIGLSSLRFHSPDTDVQFMSCQASFRYTLFDVLPIS